MQHGFWIPRLVTFLVAVVLLGGVAAAGDSAKKNGKAPYSAIRATSDGRVITLVDCLTIDLSIKINKQACEYLANHPADPSITVPQSATALAKLSIDLQSVKDMEAAKAFEAETQSGSKQ